jgi:two-component system sensor histidine kinase RegB
VLSHQGGHLDTKPSRHDHKGIEARLHVDLSSLLRLRWGVSAALLLAAAVAFFVLDLELPRARVLALIAFGAVSNAFLAVRPRAGRTVSPRVVVAVLLLDVVLLTALLHSSGGANNPFSVLYLIYVTQAAVMVDRRWIWTITAVSAIGYGLQFAGGDPHAGHEGGYVAHLQGMWIAFSVAAGLIAHHVGRLSHEVREREREVLQLREQAARTERLVALTTLAAGAAHELNTPLGTVALVARELERRANSVPGLLEDAQLIRSEVERCRKIIEQMIVESGETVGEAPEVCSIDALLDELRRALPPGLADRLDVDRAASTEALWAPPKALVRVLGNLVKNAFDASGEGERVTLAIERAGEMIRFTVRDRGSGMTREVIERAVDPFFTTKPPGKGLGLGLFWCKASPIAWAESCRSTRRPAAGRPCGSS